MRHSVYLKLTTAARTPGLVSDVNSILPQRATTLFGDVINPVMAFRVVIHRPTFSAMSNLLDVLASEILKHRSKFGCTINFFLIGRGRHFIYYIFKKFQ